MRLHPIFAALALVGAVFCSQTAHAQQQPVQWNYGFVGNVATATYPGDVVVNGTLTPVGPSVQTCGSTVTICQTWNVTWNNAAQTYTALKLAVTDTASNSASVLFDMSVGGVDYFQFLKNGTGNFGPSTFGSAAQVGPGVTGIKLGTGSLQWTGGAVSGVPDTYLLRDAAGILASRNGVNAQDYRVYNTYTNASNNEYAGLGWQTSSNVFTIRTNNNGTGSARSMRLAVPSGQAISFRIGAGDDWDIASTGDFVAQGTQNLVAGGYIRPGLTTVAGLATQDPTPRVGDMLSVSDATTCTANSTVTGGGATTCALAYSGTAWKAIVTH